MKSSVQSTSDTVAVLSIESEAGDLTSVKKATLTKLRPQVSAPGFRKGKVPLNIVEKQVDDNYFKSQFLDEALTHLYRMALSEHDLRPLSSPEVEITKFVPFDDLAFKATVQVVPPIKLPDYTKVKVKPQTIAVEQKEIDEVVENLQRRLAEKKLVDRALKTGDEATIDFKGMNEDGEPLAGASGRDYPLLIGSDSFITGFEDNLVGMKAGEDKTFELTFPKDYAHAPLANKKVTFEVTLKSINELVLPKLDEEFAKKVGPFKDIDTLKDDIKEQLTRQKEQETESKLRDDIIGEIVKNASFELPDVLVQENIASLLNDFKQNLVYRGITFPEYLKQAGQTEDEYIESDLKPRAEDRVKTGLLLAEIARKEEISITDEELEVRLQVLRTQHQNDAESMTQLQSPDVQQEIASRMVTEKTVEKLVEYCAQK